MKRRWIGKARTRRRTTMWAMNEEQRTSDVKTMNRTVVAIFKG